MSAFPAALCVGAHAEKDQTIIFLQVTLPVMSAELLVYFLVISPIFRKHFPCNPRSKCMRFLTKWFFCFLVIVALLVFALAVIAVEEHGAKDHAVGELLEKLAWARLQSWILWFPLHTGLPCVGFAHCWYAEHKAVLASEEAMRIREDSAATNELAGQSVQVLGNDEDSQHTS